MFLHNNASSECSPRHKQGHALALLHTSCSIHAICVGSPQPEQRCSQGSGEKGPLACVQNPPCVPTGEYYEDHVSKIRSITTKFYNLCTVLRSR